MPGQVPDRSAHGRGRPLGEDRSAEDGHPAGHLHGTQVLSEQDRGEERQHTVRWWRWGRVELPVQNPSPETTTSVSDGLSSIVRTGIGTLPDDPVTCP